MRTKHRFGRRRPFTALGRGAVNSRKFPRGGTTHPEDPWGGQRSHRRFCLATPGGVLNAETYLSFVDGVLLPHYYRRRHRVYLIQDNASFHKKPGVLEFFAKHSRQIEVFSLPPYSPDFNATERLWHYTRKESTHNRYFDRPAALCQSLFATFADMQRHPEKICGLLVPFF
jgi:transposase